MIKITDGNTLIAIILPSDYHSEGIEFFTPNNFSQQLAYMNRPKGYEVPAHFHNKVSRQVSYTQETLFIRRGRVKLDFYSDKKVYLESYELKAGDVVLLAAGGHGLIMLEETEIIEVKQGPYLGDDDKVVFKK